MVTMQASSTLRPDTLLRRTEDWLSTELDGAVIMMHASSGRFVGFNESASSIWRLLETPLTLEQISARLSDEFEVTPGQALVDMGPLLALLIENGAVSRDDK